MVAPRPFEGSGVRWRVRGSAVSARRTRLWLAIGRARGAGRKYVGSSVTDLRPMATPRTVARQETEPPEPPATRPEDREAPPSGPAPARAMPRPAARPQQRGRWLAIAAGVLLLAAGWLAWRYAVPRPAELLTVATGTFQRELRGPGTLDAIQKANVSANIQGVLTAVNVDVGDRVHAGEVVAQLAAQDLVAQLAAARAAHEAAVKAVRLAEADHRKAEAARANAARVRERRQALIRTGATSQSALDDAEMTHEQAMADMARTEAAISQAQASEAAAAAQAEASKAQLDKTVIRAPMDGVVVARKLNTGDLVLPGSAILEIVDPTSVVLSARFDESIIASVAPGQGARLLFSDADRTEIPGAVRRLARQVDTETREFVVDITPRALPRNWAMGQRGTAILDLGARTGVIAVPVSAVAARGETRGVYVLGGGRAWWRPVETGGLGDAEVEVRAGLKPGNVVLTRPDAAYPGMRVSEEARAP